MRDQKLNIGIQIESSYAGANYNLKGAMENLEKSLLEPELKNEVKNAMEVFLAKRDLLEQHINYENLFLSMDWISEYLVAYWELVRIFMLKLENLLRSPREFSILNDILHFGYDMTNRQFSMYSPLALNVIYKINKIFNQYIKQVKESGTNKLLEVFYLNTILNLVQGMNWKMQDGNEDVMKWLKEDENQDIVQVTPVLNVAGENVLKLSFDVKYFSEMDSFHDSDSAQIAEKVIHELKLFLAQQTETAKQEWIEFKVAMIGSFDLKYLKEEFLFYLENILEKEAELQKLILNSEIHIILEQYATTVEKVETKIQPKPYITVEIHHSGTVETFFQDAKLMEELAKSHHVIILADCVKLYNIATTEQIEGFTHIQGYFAWDAQFCKKYNNTWNKLDALYKNMAMFVNTKAFRNNARKVKTKILNYSEYLVQENSLQNKFSTIYIIAADVKSRECDDPYRRKIFRCYESSDFSRERFSWCTRFGTHQENPDFPCHNQHGQFIAFNMWQFIEKIGLERLKEQIDFIGEIDIKPEIIFSQLQNRYLYLDYSKWKKQLWLLYEEDDQILVENLWMPLFHYSFDNLFSRMFRSALYCVLYRNAQSIQDLIVAISLSGYPEMIQLGDVKPKVKTMFLKQTTQYSYSSKKIWLEEVITALDDLNTTRYLYNILDKKKQITGGGAQICSEICKACREMACMDSDLYERMKNTESKLS